MTKEEYLNYQQELQAKRDIAARLHREALDNIEIEHSTKCIEEKERYLRAKRVQKEAYVCIMAGIASEAAAIGSAWIDEHSSPKKAE